MARTRAHDYQDKQRTILDTAASVISNYGIDKASMSRISSNGQFSKALLYHYYPSKEALIFDLVKVHLNELESELAAVDDATLAPEARLQRLITRALIFYEEQSDYHTVQLNIAGVLAEQQMCAVRTIERRIVQRFSDLIGAINPALADDRSLLMPTTMSLFGMLNWAYTWFRPDGALSRREYARLVTQLFLNGARHVPQLE